MCADPLVTMFAIIGVGFVTMTLFGMACEGLIDVLDWWIDEEIED